MNSHRPPHEIVSAPYSHYHQVIEESYRPVPPTTHIYGTGPVVKVKPAPQPPARFVETLRARGIKTRIHHYRYVDDPVIGTNLAHVSKYERKRRTELKNLNEIAFPPPHIFQNGGQTHVSVQLPDGREAKGVAVCSTADPYVKKLGVWIATKRALASLKNEGPVLRTGPAVG